AVSVKITYSWLKEFTQLTVTPAELAQRLTLAGLEVESVEPVAPPFSGVVVGEVLECGRHPEDDKLSLCQVTIDRGAGERPDQAREAAGPRVERHAVLRARARPRRGARRNHGAAVGSRDRPQC